MKIFLAPTNIAGQPGVQAMGLRTLGHKVDTVFPEHPFSYSEQPSFSPQVNDSSWQMRFSRAKILSKTLGRYDVYHYHYGESLVSTKLGNADARINRMLGGRVIMEFWGSEVRKPSIESARNPYYINSYNEDDNRADDLMRNWSSLTEGHVIVADGSFIEAVKTHFEHVHIVRQAVNVSSFTKVYPDPDNKSPIIVHIPSQLAFKGTDLIRESIKALKQKKLDFEYLELTGVSHLDAMHSLAKADLVIDQIRCGSHGIFAVEAMAMGKPVICYILQELLDSYPEGFPIINANPDNLETVLEEWITSPALRHDTGKKSRVYAERVHDMAAIAHELVQVYEKLPS